MAGNGTARSAGVAYIDLAVGDAKKLIEGINQIVRQAADQAQSELGRGFDVSGHTGSFQTIVDAASAASSTAGSTITEALTQSANDSAASISSGITAAVSEAATAAGERIASTMGDAGRMAGEQLTLNFEEAARDIQLPLFSEELLAQAAAEGRLAAEEFARGMNEQLARENDQSTASLGNVFSSFHFRGLVEDVTSSLTGTAASVATTVRGIAAEAGDAIADSFRNAGNEGGNAMAHSFEEFRQGITYSIGSWGIGYAIGNAISTGVSNALSAAKSAIIDFNSEMQSAQISFGTLLGSNDQGNTMLDQLKKFTLSTPFMFKDIAEGAQKLLALGINAKDVIPDLRGLGDAVSALGGDGSKMNEVVNVFGEMAAKGQIMEVQIRELQIRGIPALQILANEYGVSTTELQKMIRSGKVMADDALPKLIDGMEKGTRSTVAMGGEMARQSLTFRGSVSNLKDGVTQFAAGAFKPAFDSLNGLTAKLANFASGGQLEKFVAPVASIVGAGIKDAADFFSKFFGFLSQAAPVVKDLFDNIVKFSILKQVFEAIGPVLLVVAQAIGAIGHNQIAAKVIADLVEGFILLRAAEEAYNLVLIVTNALMEANPAGLVISIIAALVIGFVALYQHSALFRTIVKDIGDVFGVIWRGILVAFYFVKDALVSGLNYVAAFIGSVFKSSEAKSFFTFLQVGFAITKAVIEEAIRAIGAVLGWLWTNVFVPVAQGIATAFRFMGAAAVWFWKEILEPVLSAIWFAARLLFVIVFTLIVTPFVIAWHLIELPVKAIWLGVLKPFFEWFGAVAVWLWRNVLAPFGDFVAGLFSGKLAKAVEAFWKGYIVAGFQEIGGLAVWLWKNVLEPFGAGVMAVLGAVGAGALWLWKNALEPAFQAIADVAVWLWRNVFVPFGDALILEFKAVATVAEWLWKNAIGPFFHAIGDLAEWLWREAIKPAFDAVGAGAKWLYENILKPAFDGFMSVLQDAGRAAIWLWENAIHPFFLKLGDIGSSVLKDIVTGFKDTVKQVSEAWNGLMDLLKGPVNFLVDTVYTHGIEEVWNFIAPKVGIDKLPDAPHFADGGIVGGPKSAGDWIPLYATAGEGILTTDEIAALGGPSGFNALRAVLGHNGQKSDGGHFKNGGIVDSIWGGIKHVGSAIGNGLGSLESFASRIVAGGLQAVAKDMLKPVLDGLSGILPGDSILKRLLVRIPNGLIDGILSWFGGQDKKATASAASGLPAAVSGWITQAEGLAGVDSSWTAGLSQIISHESGGNPNAINLVDSNAAAGDPSRGLMQTIMATFQAYRLPSLPDNIFDPISNLVAGIRYILSRYTSIGNVPGLKSLAAGGNYVGYATGTTSAAPGWAWVGEEGPELIKLRGGEEIKSHRDSIAALRPAAPSLAVNSSPFSSGALQAPTPIVNVYVGNEPVDARIDVKLERNNLQLAQILNGGITA